ncbi:MAG TPA: carbohydrate-binding protein, partial [Polyangiaceae bacterium]
GSGIGVATSKNPTGGFKDGKGNYLINSSTPGASGAGWLFDPGALIDDDGQAYLSFGGNGETNARIIKLGSDLVSVSGTAAQLAPKAFYEASFLFKRNNVYYFAYSTNGAMRIDYLRSSSPMSGYTYGGVVGDQPPENNNNNHASEFEYKGQWYHAYHNRIVAKQAKIADTYKRNIAIEVLNFNADGSIKEVTYTPDGVPQVGTLDPYAKVEAETTNAQSGIETDVCGEGGMNVTNINNGDWIRVRGVDFGSAGAEKFTARVASASGGGSIELHLGTSTGTLIGTCSVAATGGAQKWADVSCPVTGATGVKDLYLTFTGSGAGDLFNFNYWQFTPTGGVVVGAGGSSSVGGGGGAANNGGSATNGGTSNTSDTGNSGGRSGVGGKSSTGGTNAAGGSSNPGGAGTQTTTSTANASGASAKGGTASGATGPTATTGGNKTSSTNSGGNGSTLTSSTATGGAVATSNTGSPANGGSAATNTNQPGNGGKSGSAGGAASTNTPSSAVSDASTDSGGCNCRVAARDASNCSLGSIAALCLLLSLARRRRRARRQ